MRVCRSHPYCNDDRDINKYPVFWYRHQFSSEAENGDSFVVRSQNEIGRNFNPSIGDALGIVIDEQAIQILKD